MRVLDANMPCKKFYAKFLRFGGFIAISISYLRFFFRKLSEPSTNSFLIPKEDGCMTYLARTMNLIIPSSIFVHGKSSGFSRELKRKRKNFDHDDAHIFKMACHFVLIIKWLKNWTDCVCGVCSKEGGVG